MNIAKRGVTVDSPHQHKRRGRSGFTLLEMLAALVVMGVAVSIFFQLFVGAVSLKESNTKAQTAARVAEKKLTEIRSNPTGYEWPRYEEAEPGKLLPLFPKGELTHVTQAGQPAEKPTDKRSSERTSAHYKNMTAETYTSVPSADANHAHVVVVVVWNVEGREETFSLTTAVPRSLTEG